MNNQNGISANSNNKLESISVTESMVISLRQTKPWVRLMSILGVIAITIIVVNQCIYLIHIIKVYSQLAAPPSIISIVALIVGMLILLFPCIVLYKFSNAIGNFVKNSKTEELESLISIQKYFWKFLGLLAIITIFLNILRILAILIFGH